MPKRTCKWKCDRAVSGRFCSNYPERFRLSRWKRMAIRSSSFTIRQLKEPSWPDRATIWLLWSFPSLCRLASDWSCALCTAARCLPRLEPACSTLEREACGIQIVDWSCPTSIWNFTIRQAGPWWRPENGPMPSLLPTQVIRSQRELHRQVDKSAAGYPNDPSLSLDLIWENMIARLPMPVMSRWRLTRRQRWNADFRRLRSKASSQTRLNRQVHTTPRQFSCLCSLLPRGMRKRLQTLQHMPSNSTRNAMAHFPTAI